MIFPIFSLYVFHINTIFFLGLGHGHVPCPGLPPWCRLHRPSPIGSPGGTGEDRSSEHRRGTLPARRGSETPGRGEMWMTVMVMKMGFLRCDMEMEIFLFWMFEWIVSLRYWRMSSSSCFFPLIYTYMIIYVYVIFFNVYIAYSVLARLSLSFLSTDLRCLIHKYPCHWGFIADWWPHGFTHLIPSFKLT